ncbi:MAG TPA: hypothetical protein VNY52_06050 [Solirubrobacteraceae bacterium]|nr:hypothetical protein [Solirubrobacteraceae bacterium]
MAILATAGPAAALAHSSGKNAATAGGTSAATTSTASSGSFSSPTTTTTPAGSTPAGTPSPVTSGGAPAEGAPSKPKVHNAPVTAHVLRFAAYKGPIYERTLGGQVVPYTPPLPVGKINGETGGSSVELTGATKPDLLVPGMTGRYVNGGLAAAPMSAPLAVQEIIWAGNQIVGLPYIWGGGHASFVSPGYDCSGTVSFALHGASLLATPMDSSEFMGWGGHGIGQWVTVFTDPEHAYMTVAGLRLDTSAVDDLTNQQGPRWRPLRPENSGFARRHPVGL